MKYTVLMSFLLSASFGALSAEKVVEIHEVSKDGIGQSLGKVTISETPYGLLLTPEVTMLPPGIHGFHLHENPNCGVSKQGDVITPAGAAGGHLDPEKTGKHFGPYNSAGHLGDLPALYVDANGQANYAVLAPRISSLLKIEGRALMIHAGGDNNSDSPAPLGGGGARVACGVISAK